MGDTSEHDAAARDNGARLAAWLLWRHGLTIDKLVTHTYWVSAGKTFADADTQCTNPISGKKWCSTYIFGSSVDSTAKKNWIAFKELVQSYLTALAGGGAAPAQPKQEDNDMNQEKFNQMFNTAMQQYRQSLRDNDSGTWGQEARKFVIDRGIFVGSGTTPDGTPNLEMPLPYRAKIAVSLAVVHKAIGTGTKEMLKPVGSLRQGAEVTVTDRNGPFRPLSFRGIELPSRRLVNV